MRQKKYPVGVRTIFLIALSFFTGLLFLTFTEGPEPRRAGMAFFVIASLLSLPLFALAVSPWSENRRVPVLIAGVVMFISGLPFLLATLLEARVDWYFFTVVLIAACVMLFVSRHGRVPNELRHPMGWLGRGLLLLTIVFSPTLTIFGMYMEEEQDVESALWLAPCWLFFTGIAFKVISRKGLGVAPVKPLLFAGEFSILLSIPLGFMLHVGGEEYGRNKDFYYVTSFCCAGVFSVLVFLRATIGSWLLRRIVSSLLLLPFLLAVIYPFLWMVFGIFKTNHEFYQPLRLWPMKPLDTEYWSGLADTFFPDEFSMQNVRGLLAGEFKVPFGDVFGNSLLVSLGQALGAVALSAMAGYAFARFQFRGKRALFVLAIALILIPRQLFAVPLFSWANTLGLSDSLFGVILPGVITGLGVIYFTQVFSQLPDEYLQAARVCGAPELRVFITMLPLVWPALLSYGMIHFILAWHEHLVPMYVLTTESQMTLPLALTKLYDVSYNVPQGVQMAASTLALIPTAVLFAVCYRKFKSSLSEML